MLFYEPERRDRGVLPHDPFKALVAPRPIGWISTMSAGGRVNLAPYSFDLDGNRFGQHLVIGQVVGIHLDARAIDGDGVDTAALRPVARCGGPGDYAVVERVFQMFRPGA
ncbi:MAG: hypothetical protein JOZ64_10455 [Solirubrobacterales bacterium]|nr:hypothetical protein [Solirubrobacterales bacterium]